MTYKRRLLAVGLLAAVITGAFSPIAEARYRYRLRSHVRASHSANWRRVVTRKPTIRTTTATRQTYYKPVSYTRDTRMPVASETAFAPPVRQRSALPPISQFGVIMPEQASGVRKGETLDALKSRFGPPVRTNRSGSNVQQAVWHISGTTDGVIPHTRYIVSLDNRGQVESVHQYGGIRQKK